MFESLSQRTVIIGNSGAGKSALAESLATLIHVPVIDLDLLNWEGDGYGRKRDEVSAPSVCLQRAVQDLGAVERHRKACTTTVITGCDVQLAANLLHQRLNNFHSKSPAASRIEFRRQSVVRHR